MTYQPHWLDRTQVRVDAAKDEIRRMVAAAKYRASVQFIQGIGELPPSAKTCAVLTIEFAIRNRWWTP